MKYIEEEKNGYFQLNEFGKYYKMIKFINIINKK